MKWLEFGRGIWSWFGDYWKWAALLAVAALLVTSHGAAYRIGYRMAEADRMEGQIAVADARIDQLGKALGAAAVNGAALEKMLGGLRQAAVTARQELRNVLPSSETDHACDYPAALRGLQNRASGYPGGADFFSPDGAGGAAAAVQGR